MLCLWSNVPNKGEIFLNWHIGSQLSIRNSLSEVRRSLWLFEPRKGFGAAQSSTSMELWFLMDLDLYASDIIGNPLYEKVYSPSGLICLSEYELCQLLTKGPLDTLCV